jgi:hypothetical protein
MDPSLPHPLVYSYSVCMYACTCDCEPPKNPPWGPCHVCTACATDETINDDHDDDDDDDDDIMTVRIEIELRFASEGSPMSSSHRFLYEDWQQTSPERKILKLVTAGQR